MEQVASLFTSLFPSKLIKSLKRCVNEPRGTYLKAESRIVFVCGAVSNPPDKTLRDKFIDYANVHLRDFRFFKAEEAFAVLTGKNKDLLELEEKFAGYCDCIILILESHGAVAELGAFTMDNTLSKLVLAINDNRYKGMTSFINDGPLARADKVSRFKPTIHANFNSILSCVEMIKEKLEKIKRSRNQLIDLMSYETYKAAASKNRLLFLADLIHLFSPLKRSELIELLKNLYGEYYFKNLAIELAMLGALGLLEAKRECGEYLVRSLEDRGLFYDFRGLHEPMFRGNILNYYYKKSRERIDVLLERKARV